MKTRPTSKEVAELAGVSRTTVSYVLNNKSGGNIRISEETRAKVWSAAEQLQYHPIVAAQMLRTNRSNMLAVMVPRVENPFYPHFARAIQDAAEQAGFEAIIYSTNNELAREKKFMNVILSRGIDGVVMQTYQLHSDDLETLVSANVSVVIHGETPTHPFVDNIVMDEARAVQELVTYLIQKGHRRIATIAGPEETWAGRLRKDAYLTTLRAHGIPIDESLIITAKYRRGFGARAMQSLLELDRPPTAVFAANDFLAVDALLYAVDAGLKIPDDVAIVGFDDIPEAIIVRPRLTTVRKDVEMIGATAVRMLIERLESEEPLPARVEILPHRIIVRDSA
ncbi:MAG: LacI family transcriptional regulator [Chloroflexi bacterium]|nr:LacI family transcriptional regulator [Chloroflexota bacterium]